MQIAKVGSDAMKDETGEIFTLDDVAAYLKVGKRTVYRLAAANKIPTFRAGGTWPLSRVAIDAWIKQQSMHLAIGDDDDNGSGGAGCVHSWQVERSHCLSSNPYEDGGLPSVTTAGEALADPPMIFALALLERGQIVRGCNDQAEPMFYASRKLATAWSRLMRQWSEFKIDVTFSNLKGLIVYG